MCTYQVRAQESGWLDHSLVKGWFKYVWQCKPEALLDLHSMLIPESFQGHATEQVRKRILKKL